MTFFPTRNSRSLYLFKFVESFDGLRAKQCIVKHLKINVILVTMLITMHECMMNRNRKCSVQKNHYQASCPNINKHMSPVTKFNNHQPFINYRIKYMNNSASSEWFFELHFFRLFSFRLVICGVRNAKSVSSYDGNITLTVFNIDCAGLNADFQIDSLFLWNWNIGIFWCVHE